jgi:hypothetical protein
MSRAQTYAGYAVLAVAFVACEVAARVRRARDTATLSNAIAMLTRSRAARWVVLAAWLWLGWHLFVRVDRG